MLISEVGNIRYSAQILANQLAQNACACTMQNAYTTHAYEDAVIEEMHDGVKGFVASHTPHVEVLMVVLTMVLHRGTSDLGGLHCEVSVFRGYGLFCLRLVGILQLLEFHLGLHVAEDNGALLARDTLDLTNRVETLDADGIALLKFTVLRL